MIERESSASCAHPSTPAERARILHEDRAIDYPAGEELLAAVEFALGWFERWEEHAPDECAFGGEHTVMKKLRQTIRRAREEA